MAIVKGDVSLVSFSAHLSFVYGRTTDFFEFILYHGTLLKVFNSCGCSLVEFLGSLMYIIVSSANSESVTSSLSICIPLIPFVVLLL